MELMKIKQNYPQIVSIMFSKLFIYLNTLEEEALPFTTITIEHLYERKKENDSIITVYTQGNDAAHDKTVEFLLDELETICVLKYWTLLNNLIREKGIIDGIEEHIHNFTH